MKHLKILMATMGLDLGGAETHIVELSKELARIGYRVSAISNGGVYVKELQEAGISHFEAPLNRRDFHSLLRSYRQLKHVIRTERPDVVHAHARIPALLCSILCKRYHIPFVTTAHFNFRTGGALGFLTRWGQKSIAVSQDLKRYLVDNYKLNPDDVVVTINGIATDKFSPEAKDSALRAELGIPEESRIILTVSRMDHNACAAAFKLIAAAEQIHREHPDTRIVVVGSGDALEEIRREAEAVNTKLGLSYVIVTGGRTDINRFCGSCDLFVGVSRAALEAMACARPAILAGNQGYLGLYTEEKLDDCIKTNFTCRDIPYPAGDVIGDEVCRVLSLPPEELQRIGQVSRARVIDSYSVGRMAGDAAAVYQSVQYSGRKKSDFVICGYYGYENAGDDAMLKSILKNLRVIDPSLSICVLTNRPKVLQEQGIHAVHRFSPFAVRRVIRESRVMLFGGGNLIQDATSTKSLYYYLWLLRLARRYMLPTMLYSNGIGPLNHPSGRRQAAKILDHLDLITLREEESLKLLHELGVSHPRIEITADEVLTNFPTESCTNGAGTHIAISLRSWPTLTQQSLAHIAAAADRLATKYQKKIVLIPMQEKRDYAVCSELAHRLSSPCEVAHAADLGESVRLIRDAVLVIGMRLHSLIFATGCAVPAVGIVYDTKITGFLNYIGTSQYFSCDSVDEEALYRACNQLISDCNREALRAKAALLREKASRNAQLAISLLEGEKNI